MLSTLGLAAMLTTACGSSSGHQAASSRLQVLEMIQYIDQVPEKVHHPKEDEHLFARLRLRSPRRCR